MRARNARLVAAATATKLANLIQQDGRFLYSFDCESRRPIYGYNILRHAGSVWALSEAKAQGIAGVDASEAALRAMDWLLHSSLRYTHSLGHFITDGTKVKTGASALTVIALVSLMKSSGPLTPEKNSLYVGLTACLLEYILSQVNSRGEFHSIPAATANDNSSSSSNYCTAQALFALLSANKKFRFPIQRTMQLKCYMR
jgi:hypothetical protein